MGTLAIASIVGVGLVSLVMIMPAPEPDPATVKQVSKAQSIDFCWQEHGRKSIEPVAQRFIASVCENIEREYFEKYGRWHTRNGR